MAAAGVRGDDGGERLTVRQARVLELAAPLGHQLTTEQLLDVPVRVGPRGRDHPHERVDRRAQQLAGAQVLGDGASIDGLANRACSLADRSSSRGGTSRSRPQRTRGWT